MDWADEPQHRLKVTSLAAAALTALIRGESRLEWCRSLIRKLKLVCLTGFRVLELRGERLEMWRRMRVGDKDGVLRARRVIHNSGAIGPWACSSSSSEEVTACDFHGLLQRHVENLSRTAGMSGKKET